MKPRLSSLVVALLAGACSLDTPVIDYTGLTCSASDQCGLNYSCSPQGKCVVATGGQTSSGGSSGRASSGGTTGSSHASTSSGSGSSSTGASSSGGSGSSSGSSSGNSSSGTTGSSSGSTGAPPIGLPTLALGRAHGCGIDAQGAIYCWGNDDCGQLGAGNLQSSWLPEPALDLTSGAVAIAAGGDQSCALNTAGAVICWGDQSEGAGGDNLSYVTTPAYESGLSTGVTALAVGYSHACAIAAGGAVKCWGDNDDGQLGNGTFNSSSGPVTVSTFASQASSVTAGDYHSCALRLGTVSCWGNNISGQLGDGLTGNPATTAVAVSNLTGAVAVAAGTSHTCAITDGGAVQCWGANDSDQLGTTFAPGGSSTPVPVTGLGSAAGVAAVAIAAGGDHSCVLSSVGGVYCWGSNTYGELGSSPAAAGAVQVTGLDAGMVAIAAGQHSSCAQSVAGDVVCWGYGGDGELGGGSVGNTEAPQNLDGGSPAPDAGGAPAVVSLAVGAGNSLALTATGQALAWGENLDGQLGSGDLVTRLLPTPMVALDAGVVSISTGTDHGCATLTTGTVLCWGSNDSGQLGNGSTTSSLAPVAVTGLPAAATAVACGGSHSCAIAGGALYCWGENSTGELGNGTTTGTETPGLVVGLDGGVAAVQANQGVTCALTQRGDLFCWGQNPEGLLGNGNGQIIGNANGIPSTIPAQVTGLASGVTDFSIGSNHGCAVIDGGAVECWGQNFFGELGDGNAVAQGAPVPVNGLASGFKSVTVGDQHSCALNQQGGVFCWGRGSYGEMGNGMTTDQNDTPTAVTGLASGVLAVAAGDGHTCALTDGGLLCWGYNGNGSLGTGTLTNEALPTPVQ